MDGFVEFHLLKGPPADDHTLYATHTTWADKAAFEAWTQSGSSARPTPGPATTPDRACISGIRGSRDLK